MGGAIPDLARTLGYNKRIVNCTFHHFRRVNKPQGRIKQEVGQYLDFGRMVSPLKVDQWQVLLQGHSNQMAAQLVL